MEIQKAEDKNLLNRIKVDAVRFKDKVIVDQLFTELIHTICYELGIRQALDSHDVDSLFNYLQRNFKLIRLQDIEEAFNLYSGQKLEFKDSHFNSFDRIFVGKVLTSYEAHKKAERKLFEHRYQKPTETRKSWSMHEKKQHFEWLKGIYLEESERNGKAESFPEVLIASFKEIYEYMIHENLIKEKSGIELSKSIRLYSMSEKTRSKSPFEGVVKQDSKGKIPPYFFRNEVLNFFK